MADETRSYPSTIRADPRLQSVQSASAASGQLVAVRMLTTIEASRFGAVGEVPQAVATKEASVRATRLSWRRDIERLQFGGNLGSGQPLSRT